VLGALPFSPELVWPERHLGLQASQERQLPSWQTLSSLAEQHLDVSGILELANKTVTAPQLPPPVADRSHQSGGWNSGDSWTDLSRGPITKQRIGVAMDEAFHFYYQANLDYLTDTGAELIKFSPLHDSALPANLDAIFLGGGFPEVFVSDLAQNRSMRAALRSAIDQGLNCYAECGGLMLLAQELITLDQRVYPMAGVIPGAVQMTESLKHFGYCVCSEIDSHSANTFRGHEFHHSVWLGEPEHANRWSVRRKRTGAARREGFSISNVHASYVHLHFRTSRAVLRQFLNRERSKVL
jgi:cobyrinic acid a,c-diamide synthase